MAQNQQSDFIDDLQDPDELQANIAAADDNAVAQAPNQFQQNNALMRAGGNQIGQAVGNLTGDPNVGDPRVVQARKISMAMRQIIQDSSADAPADEDPLAKQQRLASAVASGMANISPQIALKANMQAVALQQASAQQSLLTEQTKNTVSARESTDTKVAAEKQGQVYQVHGVATGKDGLPVYKAVGDPVSMYNGDGSRNPDFNTQLQKNIADAKAQGLQSPQFTTVDKFQNSKDQVAMIRAQAQASAADRKASAAQSGLTDAAVGNSFVMSIVAPNMTTRFSQVDKERMANFAASKGISAIDVAAAQSQMKALNAAAVAQGTRVGNIKVMEQSISAKNGLADQVLQTLDKVDRTRFPALNAGIVTMKNAAGSPEESRYHVAMQGLITEYARVISGAQGVTSDQAREQATDLLKAAGNPAAIRAAVDQIKNGELAAINQGSDQAIELIAHPERYGAIVRVQTKAGIPFTSPDVQDPVSPPTHSGEVAAKPAAPAGVKIYNPSTGKFD